MVSTVFALIWLMVDKRGPFAVAVLVPTIVIGIGGGLMKTLLATLVTTGVRSEHAGAASGLMNTAKQFGSIGLAAATTSPATDSTDRAAFVLMSAALLAVIATMAAIPTHRSWSQRAMMPGRAS